MLKTCAIIFGLALLVIGILGFVPQIAPNNLLFGIFQVNFEHNLIHIAAGIASLLCGIVSGHVSRVFFQIFGIIYGLVTLPGFYYGERPIFGMVVNHIPDAALHLTIALIALYLGFGYPSSDITTNGSDKTPRDRNP